MAPPPCPTPTTANRPSLGGACRPRRRQPCPPRTPARRWRGRRPPPLRRGLAAVGPPEPRRNRRRQQPRGRPNPCPNRPIVTRRYRATRRLESGRFPPDPLALPEAGSIDGLHTATIDPTVAPGPQPPRAQHAGSGLAGVARQAAKRPGRARARGCPLHGRVIVRAPPIPFQATARRAARGNCGHAGRRPARAAGPSRDPARRSAGQPVGHGADRARAPVRQAWTRARTVRCQSRRAQSARKRMATPPVAESADDGATSVTRAESDLQGRRPAGGGATLGSTAGLVASGPPPRPERFARPRGRDPREAATPGQTDAPAAEDQRPPCPTVRSQSCSR